MIAVIGILCLLAGLAFITLAGLGVARLPDAFQRMHASTKAGTLGASLTVIGAALLLPSIRLASVGLTILFLLLTLPVASQLLARAAYKSGARLTGLTRGDPLASILRRQDLPLEERVKTTETPRPD